MLLRSRLLRTQRFGSQQHRPTLSHLSVSIRSRREFSILQTHRVPQTSGVGTRPWSSARIAFSTAPRLLDNKAGGKPPSPSDTDKTSTSPENEGARKDGLKQKEVGRKDREQREEGRQENGVNHQRKDGNSKPDNSDKSDKPDSSTVSEEKLGDVSGARGTSSASGTPPAATPPPGGTSSGDGGRRGRTSGEKGLLKQTAPEVYPQVLAIPITKRPLFPGFYKIITIKDPDVSSAVTEMLKRGQPYVGAFMVKDREGLNSDDYSEDVIHSLNDVHDVGVFAQITSAIPIAGQDGAITAVLYPHRRIRLSSLVPPRDREQPGGSGPDEATIPDPIPLKGSREREDQTREKKGDVVASFEEGTPGGPDRRQLQMQAYDPTFFLRQYRVSLGNVENLMDEPTDPKSPKIRAVTNEIVNAFRDIAVINSLFRDQIATFSMSQSTGNVVSEPAKLADFAAAVSSAERGELQEILSCLNIEERMEKALVVLKKEFLNAKLQSKITRDVEEKINKRQREYWLTEQMKGIRRELGIESDGKDKLVEKFKAKADSLSMPEAARKVFDEEINKLAHLETAASEFNVTRNYLDWLTQIPWGQKSPENFNIQHAIQVLNEDHYGLEDVKDRILEFIAVGKLCGSVEGKILCFVGPPGVGKTSIGKSIARALNRQYYRFSVGGLTDVAEIKGHRRTYVGALPGRIIQALKKCQTENPLVLIDEIDKIGRGWQGDPSSALLELLDPEQNSSFLDHYMDVPVDLSKVLFVCTANMTDTIPRPLLDRMEIITLSGYVANEKMAIADKYLGPAAKEAAGLKDANVILTRDAIEELIKSYCRESGVRNLKKHIEKVYRKAALKIVQQLGEDILSEDEALTDEGKSALKNSPSSAEPETSASSEAKHATENPRVALKVPDTVHMEIGRDNLKDYVGPPVFTSDRLYDVNPVGVAMGLAWTQMGGSAMYVESILRGPLRPGSRPELDITGNLKQVMKESSSIAYSFAKSFMLKEFPGNHFFERARLHLHVPDGAVPKDGPSAGITMATSMLSLALDATVNATVAMTGELTLTGKVLRIGGLREKTVAARRAGCNMIIFPQDNMSDWLELPTNIKEGIEGRPVSWYPEVFNLVFEGVDRDKANKCISCQWKADHPDEKTSRSRASRKDENDDDNDDE